uniref:T-box domain-containing protein n=2 Tax=Trichobilharzia regenti TaxID=157069 RepID=A0AA85ISP0_TRIRE|nr:unnamed protein product [Trichobilharzia regenti]
MFGNHNFQSTDHDLHKVTELHPSFEKPVNINTGNYYSNLSCDETIYHLNNASFNTTSGGSELCIFKYHKPNYREETHCLLSPKEDIGFPPSISQDVEILSSNIRLNKLSRRIEDVTVPNIMKELVLGDCGGHIENDDDLWKIQKMNNISVSLENASLWAKFDQIGTEMIVTKCGRRMFPNFHVRLSGLHPEALYLLALEFIPCDEKRYRYSFRTSSWEHAGKSDPQITPRIHLHPDGIASGKYWMRQAILFDKLKLTNNPRDQNGHIILNSMHKYQTRLNVIYANDMDDVVKKNDTEIGVFLTKSPRCIKKTFTFPETSFFAVTAYQNNKVTRLKISSNPFAKGFRDCDSEHCRLEKQYSVGSDGVKNGIYSERAPNAAFKKVDVKAYLEDNVHLLNLALKGDKKIRKKLVCETSTGENKRNRKLFHANSFLCSFVPGENSLNAQSHSPTGLNTLPVNPQQAPDNCYSLRSYPDFIYTHKPLNTHSNESIGVKSLLSAIMNKSEATSGNMNEVTTSSHAKLENEFCHFHSNVGNASLRSLSGVSQTNSEYYCEDNNQRTKIFELFDSSSNIYYWCDSETNTATHISTDQTETSFVPSEHQGLSYNVSWQPDTHEDANNVIDLGWINDNCTHQVVNVDDASFGCPP